MLRNSSGSILCSNKSTNPQRYRSASRRDFSRSPCGSDAVANVWSVVLMAIYPYPWPPTDNENIGKYSATRIKAINIAIKIRMAGSMRATKFAKCVFTSSS